MIQEKDMIWEDKVKDGRNNFSTIGRISCAQSCEALPK
jgi:hypothetical protein